MSRMSDLHIELTDNLGREPTDDDLRAHVAITVSKTYTDADMDEWIASMDATRYRDIKWCRAATHVLKIAKQLRRERDEARKQIGQCSECGWNDAKEPLCSTCIETLAEEGYADQAERDAFFRGER